MEDVTSVKGDEAGAHNRKSRWCSVAAGNQISATPTVNHGARSRRLPDSSHRSIVRPVARPNMHFSSSRARPGALHIHGGTIFYDNLFARLHARQRGVYAILMCRARSASCLSVVSGRDVYAGEGTRRRSGLRVVRRDGDETRTRSVDPLVRRANEMERSKEKAGSSSRRDEDGSNRGREKRRQGMRRTKDREREGERERDTTNDLVGEG